MFIKRQNQFMKDNLAQRLTISGIGILLVITAMLNGCKSDKNETDKKAGVDSVKPAAIAAFILNKSNLTTSVKIPGELLAYQQVDLYAKVNSYIQKLHVDVGSEVNAGQLLAELEAPEINAQVSAAESKLKSQEAICLASDQNYQRLYETSKTPGTISKNDLEQALAKKRSDQAQLDAARSNYRETLNTKEYLQIKAPFSGVITARNVSAGAYVGPSGKGSDMPIFTLQEHQKLRLVVSVPEAYTAFISKNTVIEFSVSSLAGQKFKAKIDRIAGALDSKLRSLHIEMDVINIDKKLLPGMVVEVSIPLGMNSNAFVVPASAVLNSTTGVFVIAIHQNKTVWVAVKTGRTDEGRTELFGLLQTGDTVIAHAGEEIRNGAAANNYSIK